MKKPINPIISFVKDGFKNIIKGLGTSKDARTTTTYQMGMKINQALANNLYVYNWLAAKVIDIPIDDATRKWRNLLIPDPDKKKEIEEVMTSFDVKSRINLAAKWARVFGGSVILAIIDDEDQEDELVIENIKQDTLRNFIVLDRYNIYPAEINRDILDENFGQPEYYTVVRSGQKIHHTRLIKFDGAISTLLELEQNNYWGISLFTKLFEPISDSQTTSQSINNLVYESNVDVYRINGLNALVAEGHDDLVVKRLRLATEMKSIIHGIALDKEDEYEKKKNSFADLDKIDTQFLQKVSGAADIPLTRLLGISPGGQNATGESDMLNYYDNVQSLQENVLRPKLDWMDQVIMASAFGEVKEIFEYEFKPLKQLTEQEEADVDLKNAQRDQIYLDNDIIKPSDAIAELAEAGTYVTVDEIRVKEEKELEELEFEEEEVDPVIPVEPVEPVKPVEPVEPVEPIESGEE